jgi:zinc/manganese transport system permease protein
MDSLLNIITLLAPAFVAGVMISFVHVPLGQEVLRRGIIFLDLAVAQFAALGMMMFQAFTAYDDYSLFSAYGRLGAGLIAALICAFIFHVIEKKSGKYQEALIGCGFVLAASLGLLTVANSPNGGEEIKHILEGQILWSNWSHILFVLPVFIFVFAVWNLWKSKRSFLFYPLFALTIPFSVSMIGVYLVFASLIFPALAVVKVKKFKVLYGLLVSITSYLLGLIISYLFDWPAGPGIIMMMALLCAAIYLAKSLLHKMATS